MQLPWRNLHFIGLGGVGMSGLGRIALEAGVSVSGSDLVPSTAAKELAGLGAQLTIGHRAGALPLHSDLVIYSSAVPEDNPERLAAAAAGIPSIRRGEFLAQIAGRYDRVIAVAGSHGKTTITAMLAHVAQAVSPASPGYLIGGSVPNHPSAAAGDGSLLICEVDESDATLTHMTCTVGIIGNMDDDHCWSVGTVDKLRAAFAEFATRSNSLVLPDCPELAEIAQTHRNPILIAESAETEVAIPGRHNRYNAVLAKSALTQLGFADSAIDSALQTFPGVDRRLCLRFQGAVTFIEDYAHHPVEVKAALEAMGDYSGRLIVVFEPHRWERVRRYGAEFATLLAAADRVYVLPTFAAWMDDTHLGGVEALVAGIGPQACLATKHWRALAAEIAEFANPGDVILSLGAGDINQLTAPLVEALAE
jgi:UDP-N-acetylmuramate--alanine ligase